MNENEENGDEDEAPVFEGPLSVLYELFQTPRGFTSGVTNLCDSCGLESPLPVRSPAGLDASAAIRDAPPACPRGPLDRSREG